MCHFNIVVFTVYIYMPISGKKFDLQLYDGEFSPGMRNTGSAFVKFQYIEISKTVVITVFTINILISSISWINIIYIVTLRYLIT